MTTTLTYRKRLATLFLVPAIAFAGVTAEAIGDMSGAQAQQQTRAPARIDPRPNGGGDGSDAPIIRRLRPCVPGVAVAAVPCRPWTPPTHTAASEEDCSCHVTYKTVNGQRIAAKDCFVLLPDKRVHYCENPRILR